MGKPKVKKNNDALVDQLLKDAKASGIENYQFTAKELSKSLAKGYSDRLKDIDYNAPDHVMLANMEMNLFRFSAAKNLATVNELNQLLNEAKSPGEFRQKAAKLLNKVNYNYLRTEANLALRTSQNAARYQQQMEQSEDLPYLEYQTAGDSRVRSSHKALDGMVFRSDDKALAKIYPPNGHGCRCEVISHPSIPNGKKLSNENDAIGALSSEVDKNGVSEWDKMKKGRFDKNKANAQVVFDENQFYVKNELKETMGVKYNGVTPWNEMDQERLPTLKTEKDYSKELAMAWFNSKIGLNDLTSKKNIRLIDRSKRPIVIRKGDFERHLKGDRIELVPTIDSILNSPDEIYLFKNNSNGKLYLRYVKFYNNAPMNTVVELTDKELRLKSWYKTDTKKVDTAIRTGILVYKKSS